MRLLVWALFATHALILLAIVVKTKPWLTGDSPRYLALADSLTSGRGFGLIAGAVFEAEGMRMPGYPLFIALCYACFGHNVLGVVVAQALLFLLSVWLVYRISKEAFGYFTSICFLVLSAFYPFVAYSAAQVSPEIPTVFLTTLALFLLLKPTWIRFAGAGAAVAAATYMRPNMLLLGVALAAASLVASRRLILKGLLMLLMSALLVLPWAIHNYNTFGVFTPTTVFRGTGLSLFLATWQSKVSVPSLVSYGMRGEVTPELANSGMLKQVHEVNKEIGVPPETVFVTLDAFPGNEKKALADKAFMCAALSNMRAWPLTYLRSSATNTLRMWFSAHLPETWPSLVRLALLFEGMLVLLLGLAGALLAALRSRDEKRLIVAASVSLFLYFTFTLCWLHTEARYTIPARLVLVMFAAYALSRLLAVKVGRVAPAIQRRIALDAL